MNISRKLELKPIKRFTRQRQGQTEREKHEKTRGLLKSRDLSKPRQMTDDEWTTRQRAIRCYEME